MTTTSTWRSGGVLQRVRARRAAIDGDDQRRPALREFVDRLAVGAQALEQPVGNVDGGLEPLAPEEASQQRGRGGAVDVIVAEDRDLLLRPHRIGDPRRGKVHVDQRGSDPASAASASDQGIRN